ncbi:hypothetical protein POM88_030748 [Heracleum sosnowskyi]|uniref:Protein kinase domain-containing protein n=1 Tax=Heracleum sosnowskyi TaxID=360622 RepID=A0AAD8HWI2_9APIA|nr:hypothetical protein POM88_030748 [Heracleum sosnowskyi]
METLLQAAKEQKLSLQKIPSWISGWKSPWKGKVKGGELISEGETELYNLGIRVGKSFSELFSDDYHPDAYTIKAIQVYILGVSSPISNTLLQNFVSNTLANGGVKEIIDPAILHELSRDDAAQVEDCLSLIFNIGVKCASELPQFRPEISDVLSMLETFRIILQINTGRSETNANKSSPPAAVLTAQRNLKSLLTKKMAPTSSTISMLPSVTVSYMDLHKATNGLCITHLVGAGGYGSVYRGTFHQEHGRLLLRDSGIEDETGTTVAIKVFNLQRRGF